MNEKPTTDDSYTIQPNTYQCHLHGIQVGNLIISDGTVDTVFCAMCLLDLLLRSGLVPMKTDV